MSKECSNWRTISKLFLPEVMRIEKHLNIQFQRLNWKQRYNRRKDNWVGIISNTRSTPPCFFILNLEVSRVRILYLSFKPFLQKDENTNRKTSVFMLVNVFFFIYLQIFQSGSCPFLISFIRNVLEHLLKRIKFTARASWNENKQQSFVNRDLSRWTLSKYLKKS